MGFNGNIVCLVVDRLHVGYLGAYGNTWIQTPALDRLAAESVLFDRAIIDSPELATLYRSYWEGRHAAVSGQSHRPESLLPARFAAAGWQTLLVTDDAEVAEFSGRDGFADCQLIGSDSAKRKDSAHVVDDMEQTDAAPFFAAAGDALKKLRSPSLLWLHTGTLGRLWDAPLEFRAQYRDEEDPDPQSWANVPSEVLPADVDPDRLLAITHAYAGQVSFVDQSIGWLLELLDESAGKHDTLFVLISARGFPLGEHRRVGPCQHALYSELVHIPWLVRFPNELGRAMRTQRIVQPPDLAATILDFAGFEQRDERPVSIGCGRSLLPLVRGEQAEPLDRAYILSTSGERAFVTPSWSLRVMQPERDDAQIVGADVSGADVRTELFVKPDDWFDINEVSSRCPDIVESMLTAMEQFDQACNATQSTTLPALPTELTE